MRLKRTRGGVGEWTFSDETRRFTQLSRAALDAIIDDCQRIAVVLEEAELLLPTEVVFFAWQDAPTEPDGRVAMSRASEIAIACAGWLDAQEREVGFRAPTEVHVFGNGIVLGEDGTRRLVPDLVWLSGSLLGTPLVTVRTQSDVWLPYDLRGRPQAEIHARNHGRLERALAAIEGRCGLAYSEEELTDYARMVGYRLENLRDGEGEIADVITDENAIAPEPT